MSESLPAAWHKLLLTLHAAASVGALGADLALFTLGMAGLGGTDQAIVYPAAHLIAAWLVAPLACSLLEPG